MKNNYPERGCPFDEPLDHKLTKNKAIMYKITVNQKSKGKPENSNYCETLSTYTCFELPEASICDGCRKSDSFEKQYPELICLTPTGELAGEGDYECGDEKRYRAKIFGDKEWELMPIGHKPINAMGVINERIYIVTTPANEQPKEENHTHELKCWPAYFEQIWDGMKGFELRKNDRDYKVMDSLLLKEYLPSTGYSGREIEALITYVLTDVEPFGLKDGFCILSLKITGFNDLTAAI